MSIDSGALGFGSGERAVYSANPWASRGRMFPESTSLTRSEFQRDRDRIVHTTAFRRLKHKTQVFISPDGDHYRTRLTHTIEVAQIARALARALKVDEDLAEGVALVHDFGHTPFGHTGEDALDEMLKPYGGFDHNAQSLRIVTKLERRYAEFDGINLTWESLEGLVKHNGPLMTAAGEGIKGPVPQPIRDYCQLHDLELASFASLEAQVAAIADDIAYNTHDIDDGLRSGLLTFDMLEDVPFLSGLMAEVRTKYPHLLDPTRFAYEITRRQITHMVEDVIGVAQTNLKALKPQSAEDIRAAGHVIATFSPEMAETDKQIKKLLFARIYRHPEIMRIRAGATQIVQDLFRAYMADPSLMRSHYWVNQIPGLGEAARARHVGDYLAGMTDTFAIKAHGELFDQTPDLR
ncbi:deoxyguanosinetriphosphate triphosphohydrolase [Rhizobium sp. XQZ8]|uniref:deoxyguanosinetriphosphate triphosphohydrolase n=1 Tax=Rhizobium populisoli TaxID=2859785 RepID=UPI001CA4B9E8|nr:deoxyguanosinetriphosphate triphosphohydrolase [Rhizobium populisoli]MBW6420171.1 deoxyguanosinetriphosphate triphosphohydrolase [Rhizobium populisoli]